MWIFNTIRMGKTSHYVTESTLGIMKVIVDTSALGQTETIITWLKTWSIKFAHFNVFVKVWSVSRRRHIHRLKVSRAVFPAHRMVLAACTDYFYGMFTNEMKETSQEVIELRDESVSSETLKQIIEYIYSRYLHKNRENVFQVLAAADNLQVTSVLQACCDDGEGDVRGKCFNLTLIFAGNAIFAQLPKSMA